MLEALRRLFGVANRCQGTHQFAGHFVDRTCQFGDRRLPATEGQDDTYPQLPILRVLVAEDQPVNARIVERFLTKRGHTVHLARNGVEAVAAFRDQEFDIVLMDLQMPVMDGCTAARAIRALPEAPQQPILALTAHAPARFQAECFAAGMNGFLTKPVDPRHLFNNIARVLQEKALETVPSDAGTTED